MNFVDIWKGDAEETVQDCLQEAFEKLGYKVTNYHKTDRRHENGVDMKCEKLEEKIHIQVKIKPAKSDITQLKKLSDSDADKKIYVHVENPVIAFEKEKDKTTNVEFWGKKKLHDFLIGSESNDYLRILFLSTGLARTMIDIFKEIRSAGATSPKPLENGQEKWWWVIKDRSVKLHGNLELVRDLYQRKLLSEDTSEKTKLENYLEEIFNILDDINVRSSMDLLGALKLIKQKYPQLVSEYCQVISNRSNWIGFPHHFIQTDHNDIEKLIQKWVIPEVKDISPYNQINWYLKNLKDISKAIEDGVDWVHDDVFGKP